MEITFVGCGDAFGSGGRFNTCFHVSADNGNFLIDCGASSMIAMKQLGIDPNGIQTIFITHFHADHFGGLPFLLLDARFFAKRKDPLTIVGPRGIERALERYLEISFPGSSKTEFGFPLEVAELKPGSTSVVSGASVLAALVNHGNPGGPFFAYRITADARVIAYSGDTEWTDSLIEIGRDADLFIAEAYFRERPVKLHLDLASLERHLPEMSPKRLILTHMSDDMLSQIESLPYEAAEDGMTVAL